MMRSAIMGSVLTLGAMAAKSKARRGSRSAQKVSGRYLRLTLFIFTGT